MRRNRGSAPVRAASCWVSCAASCWTAGGPTSPRSSTTYLAVIWDAGFIDPTVSRSDRLQEVNPMISASSGFDSNRMPRTGPGP